MCTLLTEELIAGSRKENFSKLDYYHYFNQKFIIFLVLSIVLFFAILILWINDLYLNRAISIELTRKNLVSRLAITGVAIVLFIFTDLPILRDKRIIDSNEYSVMEGIATYGIMDGGLLGLSKSIIIELSTVLSCDIGLLWIPKK